MHRREDKTLDSENKYLDVIMIVPECLKFWIRDYYDIASEIGVPWKTHFETHQIRDDTAFHSNPALAQHQWDLQNICVVGYLNAPDET